VWEQLRAKPLIVAEGAATAASEHALVLLNLA
jgi:hypothetical protein